MFITSLNMYFCRGESMENHFAVYMTKRRQPSDDDDARIPYS